MNFEDSFDALIGNEGGYSFNANDPGGETMWGVTARVAYANGYQGDMKYMPRDFAKKLYRKLYWDAIHADDLPDVLRFQVFDAAVNSGVGTAVKWLQEAVGTPADGVIGPLTLAAAGKADTTRLAIQFNTKRLRMLASLPTFTAFGHGWVNRICGNLERL